MSDRKSDAALEREALRLILAAMLEAAEIASKSKLSNEDLSLRALRRADMLFQLHDRKEETKP